MCLENRELGINTNQGRCGGTWPRSQNWEGWDREILRLKARLGYIARLSLQTQTKTNWAQNGWEDGLVGEELWAQPYGYKTQCKPNVKLQNQKPGRCWLTMALGMGQSEGWGSEQTGHPRAHYPVSLANQWAPSLVSNNKVENSRERWPMSISSLHIHTCVPVHSHIPYTHACNNNPIFTIINN